MTGSRNLLRDYVTILSGSALRLVIALVYFLVAANTLSLGDFGRFATASAVGLIVARVGAFGFISAVFRIGSVKPRILGAYMGGFLALFALSVPVMAFLAWLVHLVLFQEDIAFAAFALVVAAEAIGWRLVEFVSTANNGVGAYRKAAAVVLAGTLIRVGVAVLYWLWGETSLLAWAMSYACANGLAALMALIFFRPPQRLRLEPRLYPRWVGESLASMAADMVFYVQSELDKIVILSFASPQAAGLYAIAMRLIDLTATPIRSFNQIIMQRIMRQRAMLTGWRRLAGLELAIAAVSLAGFAGIIGLLWLQPGLLGRNVAMAAPVLGVMLLVPAFRNLVEYHAELLYARQRTGLRAAVLALLAGLKAIGLAIAIQHSATDAAWLVQTNGVFGLLYAVSALVCYTALLRHSPGRDGSR
jgi:O-antigen/teichoic acid export membrane protein